MWPNPQFHSDLVTFTEEILNGNSIIFGVYLTYFAMWMNICYKILPMEDVLRYGTSIDTLYQKEGSIDKFYQGNRFNVYVLVILIYKVVTKIFAKMDSFATVTNRFKLSTI